MNNLLIALKKRCGNQSIKFTEGIDFHYNDEKKTVHIQMKEGIRKNMQDDAAAFEAWALVLKANLSDLVEKVTLGWDTVFEPKTKNTPAWRHFNRFIYRLEAFSNKYKNWFKVLNDKRSWQEYKKAQGWGELVLNTLGEREAVGAIGECDTKSEHNLEIYFMTKGSEKLKTVLRERFGIGLLEVRNQYPVGVFNDEVGKQNYIFTGGKSAIDLYGLDEKGNFNIFELKAEKNVKVGIVSELFFYSSFMQEAIDGKFKSELTQLKKDARVNAFFLVSKMHPLITEAVIDGLNTGDVPITYKVLLYEISSIRFPKE